MAKHTSRNQIVRIGGIDISQFVNHIEDLVEGQDAFGDAYLNGLKAIGPPIEITGVWEDGRKTCTVCQATFTPGPEGTARLVANESGEDFGPVCPACGVAVVAPNEASA